jgi:hypothetical protein
MTYKHNTPTFNVDRKVVNFKDWAQNFDAEKEELKKMKRGTKPNSERQKFFADKRAKFNPVSHKNDFMTPDEVVDKFDAMEESKIFETHIDDNVYHELKMSKAYRKLVDELRNPISNFESFCIENGIYDQGDNDHVAAFQAALQDAIDEASY